MKIDIMNNAAAVAQELAVIKNDIQWPNLGTSAAAPATTSSPKNLPIPSMGTNDIIAELRRREAKKLNVVVFGLPPKDNIDDADNFMDLATSELGITPHIVTSSRLGKGATGKPAPLLISLRDEADKRALLVNAKKLRESKSPDVKDSIFINADLTLQERQHRAALRDELKVRLAAGEKDIGIRGGKIVHIKPAKVE